MDMDAKLSNPLTSEEIRKVAKARVSFRIHAAIYVIVNLFLAGIWFVTNLTSNADASNPWYYWPIWPHMGWGIGLAIHGYVAYGAGADWERREEEKLRKKYGGA